MRNGHLTFEIIRAMIWKIKAIQIIIKFLGIISFFILLGTIGAGDFGNVQITQILLSSLVLLVTLLIGGAFRPMEESK